MGEWDFLGKVIEELPKHSTMLGRFWLLLMLIFRIMILGTVASDLFDDEQSEFVCNTLQPGCKQVCYDIAFPISQYRFWVFHIVLIAVPAMVYVVYAMHHSHKKDIVYKCSQSSKTGEMCDCSQCCDLKERGDRRLKRLYIVNVAFRVLAEAGCLVGQWWLYGFEVKPQYACSRFPCPYTVDCFISRPTEKTVFLCFYFVVGVISVVSSLVEIIYAYSKWFRNNLQHSYVSENLHNSKQEEAEERMKSVSESTTSSTGRIKPTRPGSRKVISSIGNKRRSGRTLVV